MLCTQTPNMNNSSSGFVSDASVDEEREALCPHATKAYAEYLKTKQKLSARVSREKVSVGDMDYKTTLLKKIGSGSYGDVYIGHLRNFDSEVAVKVEPMNSVTQFLLHEGNVYRKLENGPGIPRVYWYGMYGTDYAVMIMDLLGPTLYELWAACGHIFSIKTVLMIIDRCLDVIQHIHNKNFVHRDISPGNFVVGRRDDDQLYLIDFGHAKMLSTAYRINPAAARKRLSITQPLVGTPRFASAFAHCGMPEAYRDDLESLGYMWIYFLKGRLPWQGLSIAKNENKFDRIAAVKVNTKLEDLCEDIPDEFLQYMTYVRQLRPSQMPDHMMLKSRFRDLARRLDIKYDWKFDWHEQSLTLTTDQLDDDVFDRSA